LDGVEKYPSFPGQAGRDQGRPARRAAAPAGVHGKNLRRFPRDRAPRITHWQHPGWFGYFPANNSPASVLAEILTAGLGSQCMSGKPRRRRPSSRTGSRLAAPDDRPSEGMAGVIQDTASTATLCALLSAGKGRPVSPRTRPDSKEGLLSMLPTKPTPASRRASRSRVWDRELAPYPTDDAYAMIPDKLEAASPRIRTGADAACVVATIGTTSSTAVDPWRDRRICGRQASGSMSMPHSPARPASCPR